MSDKCKDCDLFTLEYLCRDVQPDPNRGKKGKCMLDGDMPENMKFPFENQDACEEFVSKEFASW